MSAQVCFPPEWVAPLVFDPPWSSDRIHWYAPSPGPEYPRLGAKAFYPCGIVRYTGAQGTGLSRPLSGPADLVGTIPSHGIGATTCTEGPGHSFYAKNYTPRCSAGVPCPEFTICDGASGKCGKPNPAGQAT